MFRFITPPDLAIFTGLIGIVMVLTGREIGGAIVISASLGAFVFFEWWLYHRSPNKVHRITNSAIRKHNEMFPDDPLPLNDKDGIIERLRSVIR